MANSHRTAAIVGAESLLGRDLREVIESRKLPLRLKLISASERDEAGGILSEQEGEAVFMSSLQAGELDRVDFVFLAGPRASAAETIKHISGAIKPPALIDLTGALEDQPTARLRAPSAEEAGSMQAAPIVVIAHPAAIVLAIFLRQLRQTGSIRRVVAQIFEPVSERGQRGIDELQKQAVALLSLQKLKQDVFDAQVSFNMLPRYGEEAVKSLEDVETAIDRHLATLLSKTPDIPMPSLNVAHAPVFHGYTLSAWVEFETRPTLEALAAGLKAADIEVRTGDEEPPSNVGAAGQSGITVGSIHEDRNDGRAVWFWVVADNLRVAAENAAEVVREALA